MDKGGIPIALFVDLSKAFDTIDNEILINKLSFYVVRGCANGLIKSYLTNRTQYVEMEGILSDTLLIITLPQVSKSCLYVDGSTLLSSWDLSIHNPTVLMIVMLNSIK